MSSCLVLPRVRFQSTLSVRRATVLLVYARIRVGISIHALRKESDANRRRSRPHHIISIHALRKESDKQSHRRRRRTWNFNPRSP